VPLRVEPRRDRKLNRLVKTAEVRRLPRGEPLFEPGGTDKSVYLVRTGYLRIVQPGSGRARERTVAVVGPWELLWEEGMRSGPRRYRCVSGESSSVQALDSHAVALVLKSTEQTFEALLDGIARELELSRRLATGGLGPEAAQRLAMVLVDLARRWGEPLGKGTLVRQRVTHQVLADLAGAHRSTVTTVLNDWLYRGVLAAVPRGIHVAQPDRLARVANESPSSR
jgi:CRP/FNR family cyclic AMP-dependent transcriptional regulator